MHAADGDDHLLGVNTMQCGDFRTQCRVAGRGGVAKFQPAERFIVSAEVVKDTDFSRHVELLRTATKQVVEMVRQIRKRPSVEQIKEMNDVLQRVEGEADQLILDVLAKLYSGKDEPTKVIALKDLYELLEKVIDRCRDAGNAVTHIVIKHS